MRALTLDPAGPQAAPVAGLTWVLLWGGAAILALVLAMLAIALVGPERWRRRLRGERAVLALGLVFPVVALSALLVVGLTMTSALGRAPADALVIRMTGYRWWWALDYPGFTTANELVIPVGRPVVMELLAGDVIHNFWVPELAGKRDMIPGKVNRLTIEAGRPGEFYGICAEYCGGPHALMQFRVRALPEPAFAAWAAAQRRPAAAPLGLSERRGAALFRQVGCGGCHNVAGTGTVRNERGPDLTHLAARTRIGAGILPNDQATLREWTRNAHAFKPRVNMPAFSYLRDDELQALATYMAALR